MKDYKKVLYNNVEYIVGWNFDITGEKYFFIVDYENKDLIEKYSWYKCANNYIGTDFIIDNKRRRIYLHNLVMNKTTFNGKGQKITVDHINRNGFDNRKVNLRIITQSDQNINQKKRLRTVTLPIDCGIDPDDIPTGISYNPNKSGSSDYFDICLKYQNRIIFRAKSTKSIGTSLKDKLNQAIDKMDLFLEKNPDIYRVERTDDRSLSEAGQKLLDEYHDIINLFTSD